MKLKDSNPHPLDSRIEFDEKEHVYYIDKIPYDISVTGFVKSFFEEFDTDGVIQKNYGYVGINRGIIEEQYGNWTGDNQGCIRKMLSAPN